MITIRYRAVDGFRETRKFKTTAGARAYAVKMIGPTPEFGISYAVSPDGIGTIRVEGIGLRELFEQARREANAAEIEAANDRHLLEEVQREEVERTNNRPIWDSPDDEIPY